MEVRGQLVANGFAIEIEDRGLGMSEEDLAAANHRIVDRSELNLANAARLGLFVVSRLAERHGVRVRLKESAYGGTTAVVLIPPELVAEAGGTPEDPGSAPAGSPAHPAARRRPPRCRRRRPARPGAPVALAAPAPDRADVGHDRRTTPTATRHRPPAPDQADGPRRTRCPPGGGTRPRHAGDRPAGAAHPGPARPWASRPWKRPTVAHRPARGRRAPGRPATGPGEPAVDGGPAPARAPRRTRTDAGLPVRVRQANIVPELRDDPAATETDDEDWYARRSRCAG